MQSRIFFRAALLLMLTVLTASIFVMPANAAVTKTPVAPTAPVVPIPSADSDFSIQVAPSPLVTTVKPGVTTELEIQVHNSGSQVEALKIEPRSFTIDNASEEVKLNDTTPPDIANWITFLPPTFVVLPGQTHIEKVRIAVPQAAGFSYAFALLISRQRDAEPVVGSRLIKGSLALFTLINIDKPGATRKLDVTKFTVSKHVYEYLPTSMTIQFRNSGNTIVQPYGDIFIQRGADDAVPISTLPVNEKKGYILPGSTRTLDASWLDGFPVYKTVTNNDGSEQRKLVWDWNKASNFRIGKYTAKIVAVYNDGNRDVPIEGMVSFWVIPWKILLGLTVTILLVLFAVGSFVWRVVVLTKRKKHAQDVKKD